MRVGSIHEYVTELSRERRVELIGCLGIVIQPTDILEERLGNTDEASPLYLKIYFVSYMEELKFEADEEEVIYRIIQESTTNAIRHGKATEIWIRISEKDEELTIIISDNGCGCEDIKEGFGLKHIRERVELLNGEVNYQGMIGFTIIAKIPIRNKLTGKKDRDELNNLADNNDKAKDSQ